MRIDGQKRPAPHYFIEALFKKITFPQIEAHMALYMLKAVDEGFLVGAEFGFFNFSHFENEEDFTYQIHVRGGKFQPVVDFEQASHDYFSFRLRAGTPPIMPQGYDTEGTKSFPLKPERVLHYGDPLIIREEIFFHGKDFLKFEKKGNIAVRFGGKNHLKN